MNASVVLVQLSERDDGLTARDMVHLGTICVVRSALHSLHQHGYVTRKGETDGNRQAIWVATEKGLREAIRMEGQWDSIQR